SGVLGRDPAGLARDPDRGCAPLLLEGMQPSRADPAGKGFFIAEVTQPYQQVVGLVDVARETLRKQPLQLELDSGDRVWIKQLAQVFAAEQLGQQVGAGGSAWARRSAGGWVASVMDSAADGKGRGE